MDVYRSKRRTGWTVTLVLVATMLLPALAWCQAYAPAQIRVADRELADRQLLETLRRRVAQDGTLPATRVGLMVAAYAIIAYTEARDAELSNRIAAVDKAFTVYRQSAQKPVQPSGGTSEAALTEALRQDLEAALATIGDRPEIRDLNRRTSDLERQVQQLQIELQEVSARPDPTKSDSRQRMLAVGGMAATIVSAVLLAR